MFEPLELRRRCAEAEARERDLLESVQELKEALIQAVSRATAAEQKLKERSETLQADFAEKAELVRQVRPVSVPSASCIA